MEWQQEDQPSFLEGDFNEKVRYVLSVEAEKDPTRGQESETEDSAKVKDRAAAQLERIAEGKGWGV